MAPSSSSCEFPATGKKTSLRDLISFTHESRIGSGVKTYPFVFGTLICLEHLDHCPECGCLRHCFVRKAESDPLRCLICTIHDGETQPRPDPSAESPTP
jgi:hypothetical protein